MHSKFERYAGVPQVMLTPAWEHRPAKEEIGELAGWLAGWLRIRAAQHTITRNPKDSKKHSNQNLNPALSIFIKSLQHLFRLPRPTKLARP